MANFIKLINHVCSNITYIMSSMNVKMTMIHYYKFWLSTNPISLGRSSQLIEVFNLTKGHGHE
jgi:hypothetical protein